MLRAIEGAGVLALLSVFFAYLLAPVLPPVRRRVRVGRRQRPISDAVAIVLVYAAIAAPAILSWRAAAPSVRHWIGVTAPASLERLFPHASNDPLEAALARLPLSPAAHRPLRQGTAWPGSPGLCRLSAADSPRHAPLDRGRDPDGVDRRRARVGPRGRRRHPRCRLPLGQPAPLARVSRDRAAGGGHPPSAGLTPTIPARASEAPQNRTPRNLVDPLSRPQLQRQ